MPLRMKLKQWNVSGNVNKKEVAQCSNGAEIAKTLIPSCSGRSLGASAIPRKQQNNSCNTKGNTKRTAYECQKRRKQRYSLRRRWAGQKRETSQKGYDCENCVEHYRRRQKQMKHCHPRQRVRHAVQQCSPHNCQRATIKHHPHRAEGSYNAEYQPQNAQRSEVSGTSACSLHVHASTASFEFTRFVYRVNQ